MNKNYELYKGDCLDILKNIGNSTIDLIVTDVPYKVISGGRPKTKGQPSGILSKNDGKIFSHNNIKPSEYLKELYRVLKDGTHCYIFINFINLEEMMMEAKKAGFQLHTLLIWKKNNKTPSRWYMKNQEYILFMRKGKAKPVKNSGIGHILEFDNIIGKKSHPCEKPVDLLNVLIENSSNKGDIVLDPFMGTGSCCISSLETQRRFIGIEIEENYYNIAKQRIKNTYLIDEKFKNKVDIAGGHGEWIRELRMNNGNIIESLDIDIKENIRSPRVH